MTVHNGCISKVYVSLDYLLGEVKQPSDSRLSETTNDRKLDLYATLRAQDAVQLNGKIAKVPDTGNLRTKENQNVVL